MRHSDEPSVSQSAVQPLSCTAQVSRLASSTAIDPRVHFVPIRVAAAGAGPQSPESGDAGRDVAAVASHLGDTTRPPQSRATDTPRAHSSSAARGRAATAHRTAPSRQEYIRHRCSRGSAQTATGRNGCVLKAASEAGLRLTLLANRNPAVCEPSMVLHKFHPAHQTDRAY